MNLLVWIVFGVLVGWIGILFYPTTSNRSRGVMMMMALVGAVAGGMLVYIIDASSLSSLDAFSILSAIVVAIIGVITSRQFARTH